MRDADQAWQWINSQHGRLDEGREHVTDAVGAERGHGSVSVKVGGPLSLPPQCHGLHAAARVMSHHSLDSYLT